MAYYYLFGVDFYFQVSFSLNWIILYVAKITQTTPGLYAFKSTREAAKRESFPFSLHKFGTLKKTNKFV